MGTFVASSQLYEHRKLANGLVELQHSRRGSPAFLRLVGPLSGRLSGFRQILLQGIIRIAG